ncbi:hypothetical protein V6N13_008197 [Hibiscus sabdariffa]
MSEGRSSFSWEYSMGYFSAVAPGFGTSPLRLAARRFYCSPTAPFSRFRLLPFRSPLLRESLLLSFPPATKMFQFARLSLVCPWIQQQFERLTYSGISGSTLIFNSPKHFVAYYALPRLWVPRYPPSNCRIGKIGYYHIALFRLSSRVGDKRTRTADIRHRVLSWNPILTKDSCGSGGSSYRRTRNGELSPLRLFGLKNAGFYGRSATPGYRRRPWGDLVVPTGWRRWESFSGMFRSSSPLLRKSEPPVQVQDTIITAWTIRHPTRNRNDPIARAELYQLSYIPRAKWSMHEGVRCFFYSFPWRSWAILDLNQRPRP